MSVQSDLIAVSSLSHDIKITKSSLNDVHAEQLVNGNNNEHNTMKLVNILGGIDKILNDYLSESNNLIINNADLEPIYQIITTPQKYQQSVKLQALTNLNSMTDGDDNRLEDDDTFCHNFEKSNTYLVSQFGKETGLKISNILHSKLVTFIVVITVILYVVIQLLHEFQPSFFVGNSRYYISMSFCCLWIGYDIFMILEINRKAFELIITSFEFWFKLCYAITFGIFIIILHYKELNIWFWAQIMFNINILLVIFIVSSFDGLTMNKNFKVLLSAGGGAIFCYLSINFLFGSHNEDDDNLIYITANNSISSLSVVTSSTRILAIFLFKQSILTMFRKDKCVLITYKPYVKWNQSLNMNINGKIHENNNIDNNNEKTSYIEHIQQVELQNVDHKKQSISLSISLNTNKFVCNDSDCEFDIMQTNQLDASLLSSQHKNHIQQYHKKLYHQLQHIVNMENKPIGTKTTQ